MKYLSYAMLTMALASGVSASTQAVDISVESQKMRLEQRDFMPMTGHQFLSMLAKPVATKELQPRYAYKVAQNTVASDAWAVEEGEVGWDLTRGGQVTSRVFLGRDYDTGGFYYGIYRASNDPMINFMGVSVAHSDGHETELNADGCYGQSCMTQYEGENGTASAQVRIPIAPHHQARILEEMKSGKDITFRYQTKASYAEDSFKRMKMSLKGSRKAIESLERQSSPGQ